MTQPSREHAQLPPSSAHCWVRCAGWRSLHAAFPDSGDTVPAMEGTAAHWVFEQMFAGVIPVVGASAPNGIIITDEMLDGAEMFVDAVRSMVPAGVRLYVEERLQMDKVVHEQNWGTPDTFAIADDRSAIWLLDYKFGHRYVEEFENWQLIDYTAGIYNALLPVGGIVDSCVVHITIVQPRVFNRGKPVRTWTTTIGALKPYWAKLAAAAPMAMCDEAPCVPGDWCEFCNGRHACEALQRTALAATDEAFSSIPLVLPPLAAARELRSMQRAMSMLEARITGLQQQLLDLCRAGVNVPHYSIERAQGRQRWTRPIAEVIALGQMFGLDVSKPGAITPKQSIAKGIPSGIVAQMSDEPLGEWRLVEATTDKARKVFG